MMHSEIPAIEPDLAGGTSPSTGEIREQLGRILASSQFDASSRNRLFLKYVVEETLSGRADYIKGYTVALNVFKRTSDFDPQLDPVVRIEATRLRRALERYYLTGGTADPVRIDMPKGGYVPNFNYSANASAIQAECLHANSPSAEPAPMPKRFPRTAVLAAGALVFAVAGIFWLARPGGQTPSVAQSSPSIVIQPLRDLSGSPSGADFAGALTDELTDNLAQYTTIRVLSGPPAQGAALSKSQQPDQPGPDTYVLSGNVQTIQNDLRVTTKLTDARDGAVLWARTFDRSMEARATIAVEAELAAKIGASLGASDGVVAQLAAQQVAPGIPDEMFAYDCVSRSFAYRRSPSSAGHDDLESCLSESIERAPHYAEAWAQLAYFSLGDSAIGFSTGHAGGEDAYSKARAFAEHATELNPHSPAAYLALAATHYFRHELGEAYAADKRALALNPTDPDVLIQYGWQLALPGRWDEGMSLLRQGLDLDPQPPKAVLHILALDAYRRGDRAGALALIRDGALVQTDSAYLVCAAILADYGQTKDARAVVDEGRKLNARMFREPRAQFAVFNLDAPLADRLAAALSKFQN